MAAISRRLFFGVCGTGILARGGGVMDLGAGCLLPESRDGFREAIRGPAGGAIIPGAGRLNARARDSIRGYLARGVPVLLESALGLAQPKDYASDVPYVDFTWPVRTKIREFFPLRIDPFPGDTVIATFAGQPVAVRRGRLILLGSPIGPSLLCGDPDAHRWLASVLRWMHTEGNHG